MKLLYSQICIYLKQAGQRLITLQGSVQDIGITKKYLTEEDIRIERELSDMVLCTFPDHSIYAEEEHEHFMNSQNLWVFDPIF